MSFNLAVGSSLFFHIYKDDTRHKSPIRLPLEQILNCKIFTTELFEQYYHLSHLILYIIVFF